MTIEVLTLAQATAERARLENALLDATGTADRSELRSRVFSGGLPDAELAAYERLRSLDHLLHA